MAHKKSSVLRYLKIAGIVVAGSLTISHFPKIPHYAAEGVVWCANTVSAGVSLGVVYATAQATKAEK